MKFNQNSPFLKMITTVTQFIILNICYILSCIPIVTIGAATSSLFFVTLRYADQEKGYLVTDFFKSMKNNWLQSTLAFFILFLPAVILIFSGIFWISIKDLFLTTLVGVVAIIIAFYLLLALLYSLVLIGRFDTTLKQAIKNALYLPLVETFRSLIIVIGGITFFSLITIIPGLKIIWILFGFSFISYCYAFLFLAIFKNYEE